MGGNPTDRRNLWNQPRGGQWNAGLKDHLEDTLREMVCDGRLSLHEAQEAIAGDWKAAYQKYIGSAP